MRDPARREQLARRPLGATGLEVSILGLGGYHLGSVESEAEAREIVARALDAGVTFFDNAWDYHDGASETRLGRALRGRRDEVVLMTKVCTHGRGKRTAMRMLEESLRRLKTDWIDVWQIHEVIYEDDPDRIFARSGVAEALLEAKDQGKVRCIGFTGHKDPSIHMEMLSYDFPFDTVQMPLNCADGSFRSFEAHVLPVAVEQGVAVLGMKSFGGAGEVIKHGLATADEALRYAMSLPVATTISGVDRLEVLEQNLEIAQRFVPMTAEEMRTLRDRCRPLAADGRAELFKTTMIYDGKDGREQHGFPSAEALPA